tara:strand:+ start:27221 stop:28084 length:864 start_codon:yes stop_codon:yes gene_type:complete
MLSLAISFQIAAGPFAPAPPPAPEPIDNGSTAIPAKSLSIVAWAQGYENYFPGSHVDPPFQTPEKALLEAGNSDGNNTGHMFDIVSLGRGGSITLLFNPPIRNGEGYDFAVFENSFSGDFLELAWVEVSSNGVDFFRFYNISLTESDVGGFGIIDPTNVTGLAGKYEQGFGTPFDLQQLTLTHSNLNNLDLNRISHVKIIDIVGDGFHYDSITSGNGPNPIYDPYPTWSSAGFDLDAVAALYITEALYEENVPIPPLFSSLLSLLILLINQLSRSFQSPKKHKSLEF